MNRCLMALFSLMISFSFGRDPMPDTGYPSNDFVFMPGEFPMDSIAWNKVGFRDCSFWDNDGICSDFKGCAVERGGVFCDESSFDPTVEISIVIQGTYIESITLLRNNQECLDYLGREVEVVGEKGSLPFSEVLKLELGRLRDYGALLATDSMVNAFISKLLDYAHSGCSNPNGCYDMCKDIDGLMYANGNPYTLVGQGRCCSVLKDSSSGFVQTALAAYSLKVRPLADKRFFVEKGLGKAYDVFDLNGKRIGGGTFRSNVLHVKSLPAILKVEGMGCVLLK
ncbi:hypothetical protein SAMN05720469_13026 [Fibrobacter intestinalis]|uniref:Major paralogous domain-containing protein n=2 Tax=Fibrobacter intestinalis TaxID=28122 RepID=A0A1M6XD34_9BACT|nr:hypothetical protein SAMN05720469_13026 [Fibrobacter intestinalis]